MFRSLPSYSLFLFFLCVSLLRCSSSTPDGADVYTPAGFGGQQDILGGTPPVGDTLSSAVDSLEEDLSLWPDDGENTPDEEVAEEDTTPETNCAPEETFCAVTASCCASGETCFPFGCVAAGSPCESDETCINDSYCYEEGGVCIPYGTGPKGQVNTECKKVVPPGVFFPSLQCEWSGPGPDDPFPNHANVLGPPVVASFINNGKSGVGVAVTQVGSGQIAFISYPHTDGGFDSASCCGIIRIIDGKTCELLYTLEDYPVVGGSSLAVGDLDLDDDNRPEIVALAEGGGLVAFHYNEAADDFQLLWHSLLPNQLIDNFASNKYRWNGVSLGDLTGDDHPEIVFEATVYNWQGHMLGAGYGWIGYQQGIFPVIADVDVDGEPDVMLGAIPYYFNEPELHLIPKDYASANIIGGHAAIADFGPHPGIGGFLPDEAAEIALVHTGSLYILDLTGQIIFGPVSLPGGGTGGPPTIADFDGDGLPEIAAAGADAYTVFNPDCTTDPNSDACDTDGILWSQPSQDHSSNKTGSSVFDFEGDGNAEAVYGDECFLRVYDGATGEVLFSGARSSCTWHELPVIADVDADYRTEIVIGSNTNCNVSCPTIDPIFPGLRCDENEQCASGLCTAGLCRCTDNNGCPAGYQCAGMLAGWEDNQGSVCRAAHTGNIQGIRVYNDSKDRWVASRPIWNQHAYHITNVDEAGRIPPRAEVVENWLYEGLNNFRQNGQGQASPDAAPDLTLKPGSESGFICEADGSLTLLVEACNRGITPVAAGLAVAFFDAAPSPEAQPLCETDTQEDIPPGICIEVTCTLSENVLPNGAFWAMVDGLSEEEGSYLECTEGNNMAKAGGVVCP